MITLTPLEIEALWLSLRVASWAVLCSLPIGIAMAWLLAWRHFPGKSVLDAVVHVPLVVPPVVVGYVLLVLFGCCCSSLFFCLSARDFPVFETKKRCLWGLR